MKHRMEPLGGQGKEDEVLLRNLWRIGGNKWFRDFGNPAEASHAVKGLVKNPRTTGAW